MAQYQILFWKHIPSQVMAWEGEAKAKRMLPDYFQAGARSRSAPAPPMR